MPLHSHPRMPLDNFYPPQDHVHNFPAESRKHSQPPRSSRLPKAGVKHNWLHRIIASSSSSSSSSNAFNHMFFHPPQHSAPYYILDSPQGDPATAHSALSLLVRLPSMAASWVHVRVSQKTILTHDDPYLLRGDDVQTTQIPHNHFSHALSSTTPSFSARKHIRPSTAGPHAERRSSHRFSGSFSSLNLLTRRSGRIRQKSVDDHFSSVRSGKKSPPFRLFRSGSAPDLSDSFLSNYPNDLSHTSSNGLHSPSHIYRNSQPPSSSEAPSSSLSPSNSHSQVQSQTFSRLHFRSSLPHRPQSQSQSFVHSSSLSRRASSRKHSHSPETWALCWAELRAGYVLLTISLADQRVKKSRRHRFSRTKPLPTHSTDYYHAFGTEGKNRLDATNTVSYRQHRRVDFVFDATKCFVHVRDNRRSDGVRVCIVAANDAELTLRFPTHMDAEPWLWALSSTVSPYEGIALDTFQVISPLGAGAFGKVYLVRDVKTNERLALKVLEKRSVFQDQLHFESAVNERVALELVCGQSFLVRLRYATQTARYLYLVTDFYEGGDLFNFLRNHHESLMEAHAIRVIAEVVLALEAMHSLNLVYRDLKPENVLLDSDGHVRLADLGLAKKLDAENKYLTRTVCGSLVYAGPEMLAGEDYGISFDMWTLGIFIYQVLTGELPFNTDDVPVPDILASQLRGSIPRGVLSEDAFSVVCQLLSPKPEDRPSCRKLRTHPFFSSIDWDDLKNKLDHEFSLTRIMHENASSKLSGIHASGDVCGEQERLDEFLLRNFDPDEWTDMSFSDVSDGEGATSIFHHLFTCDASQREETCLLPGWNFFNRSGNWKRRCYATPSSSKVQDGIAHRGRVIERRSGLRLPRKGSQKSLP